MNIAKGIDFSINLIVGLVVLLVAGVYVVMKAQELPGYAIYLYAFYALMVIAFFWIIKGFIFKPKAGEGKKAVKAAAKKPAAKATEKPAAKPAAPTKEAAKK